MIVRVAAVLLLLWAVPSRVEAQQASYRGFFELAATAYPQTAPNDDDRLAAEGRARLEAAYKPVEWLTLASSLEARLDTLDQVERRWRVDIRDRGFARPALSIREARATLRTGGMMADVGKQFVRWGKADILTPTDRFAPRDFLEVTDGDFLGVIGGRLQYERGVNAFDLVFVPTFTPSRIPLLDRRWVPLPPPGPLAFRQRATFPDRSQYGARWSVTGTGYEFSLSYFDGFNHLPEISATPLSGVPFVQVDRAYAPLRMVGADAAVPLPWLTLKGEVASLTTTSAVEDDVVEYVIQAERQSGELSLVGGYAGEIVTHRRSPSSFAPDRGLARAFLGRASYTLDANRSLAVEAAVRRNADGVWVKAEYSQARGAHWRATLTGTLIGGRAGDFFGQYRRNSHLRATLRYSF